MAANIIDSLFVALGFQVDDKDLDAFQKKTEDAKKQLLTITGVLVGAAAGVGLFVGKIASSLDDLGDFADREQVAIEAVQELGYVAQLSGSSLDAVKASIAGVNQTIGEAALGVGRGAMTFQKLGLSAKNANGTVKSFDELMEDVADKMQGLSRQEQIAMAQKLGIDSSLVPMLAKGSDAIRELRMEAQAFTASQEDADKAGAFMDALDRTRFVVAGLSRMIAVELMPRITGAIEGFRKWVVQNAAFIKAGMVAVLSTISDVLGRVWTWIVRIVGRVIEAVGWLFKFKIVTYAAVAALSALASIQIGKTIMAIGQLTKAMTSFNFAALRIPLILGAVALALALLIDDYIAWKEGNESVIGDIVELFPAVGEAIRIVEESIASMIDWFVALWEQVRGPLVELGDALLQLFVTVWPIARFILGAIGDLISALLPIVIKIVAATVSVVAGMIEFIASSVATIVSIIASIITGVSVAIETAMSLIDSAITVVVDAFTSAADFVGGVWDAVIDKIAGAIQFVKDGVAWAADKLGFGDGGATAQAAGQAPAASGAPAALPLMNARGPLMRNPMEAQNTNTATATNTTQISAPITVNSPDPAKAGESVRRELDRVNKQAVRNGETAVAY